MARGAVLGLASAKSTAPPALGAQRKNTMDLRIAGEDEVLIELPLAPQREACCAVERLRELPALAVRLRTRALTTTLFSRFLLGDLFIHGIGGAKYDELGDEIARRFFQVEPPGFLTVSMTLWLGLPAEPASAADLADVNQQLRDLQFNPDRYLSEPYAEELRNLVRKKQDAIAQHLNSRRERRVRRLAIGRVNEAIRPWVRRLRDEFLGRKSEILRRLRSNRAARNREFSLVLHAEERLRTSLLAASASTAGSSTRRL